MKVEAASRVASHDAILIPNRFAKIGDVYYYSRVVEGSQYRIHCRKRGSLKRVGTWVSVLLARNRPNG